MAFTKTVLGMFSREPEVLYQWLITVLLSISIVKDVRHVLITNNFYDFQQEVVKCNIAILYHSKKRGRLNVTDVTDSLYDRELQYLNETHGKKRVLVVMDDLEDSSDNVKRDLLRAQPSIKELAEELFIFSTEEKAFLETSGATGYQSRSDLSNKLDHMKRIIEGKQQGLSGSRHGVQPGADPESGEFGRLRQRCRPKWVILGVIIFVAVILIIVLAITLHH